MATDAERAAVDDLLGMPASGWEGGVRSAVDAHVSFGGFHRSEQLRHLLLPALLAVQGAVGWVSAGAINYICERLIVPPADAYGVATFYALIATTPQPQRVAHVCDDVCCRSRGGSEILAALGHRNDVHASPCTGQCDGAPAVFVQRAGRPDVVIRHADVDTVLAVLDGDGEGSGPGRVPQAGDPSLRLLRRVGIVDPISLDQYRDAGGFTALPKALDMGPQRVIDEMKAANLRGRGGAAFPLGVKWQAVADADETAKYLICNADESEPGTFKDRVLMEGDPFLLIEAMTIAAYAIGANHGYIYVRAEYPLAQARLTLAASAARHMGLLGDRIWGTDFSFDIEIRSGAGAYICGEETALMDSIEGGRGEPRNKPPFPTQVGLFGMPTVINNVETLANVVDIVNDGGAAFAETGTSDSTGPKLFCLSGDVGEPGVYEVPFGTTLGDLIELAGGVGGSGTLGAVLLGGAAGVFVGADHLGMPLSLEDARQRGATLGSGVVMVFDDTTDFRDVVRRIAQFFRDESCGQCVPCRVGTVRQEELLDRHLTGGPLEADLLEEIANVMVDASICGLGHTASTAVRSAIELGVI